MTILTRPDGTEPADLDLSRRAVLIAAGYAAFDVAANAEPITTPGDGLVQGWETAGNGLPLYVARPAGTGAKGAAARLPTVIVVNEIFGVHEWIKDVCRRFARAGYVAIAPEFFFRGDPDRKLPTMTDFTAIRAVVAKAGLEQVMGELKAPVLGLYGALDKGIPIADVEEMREALKGSKSQIRLYADADHGFLADYRPSYNATAAKDAWAQLLAHFKANGV